MGYENVIESELHSFEGCKEFLSKGIRKAKTLSRPIANNTRVEWLDDEMTSIGILLHNTYIVKYFIDGTIKFNSGGWKTVTTKDRMNRFSPYYVWSERHIWYIAKSFHWRYRDTNDNDVYLYQDQLYFDEQGKPWLKDESGLGIEIKPFSKEAEKAKRKQLRQIDNYIRKGLKRLGNGEISHSEGDCWICSMKRVDDGDSMEGNNQYSCIQSHIDENYFHFSLVMNAVRSKCYDPDGQFGNESMTYGLAQVDKHNLSVWAMGSDCEHKTMAADLTLQRLQRILKQFIMKQLGI